MAAVLTLEDVARRIAAEFTFVDERDAVGIRLKPAAAITRQYGGAILGAAASAAAAGQAATFALI